MDSERLDVFILPSLYSFKLSKPKPFGNCKIYCFSPLFTDSDIAFTNVLANHSTLCRGIGSFEKPESGFLLCRRIDWPERPCVYLFNFLWTPLNSERLDVLILPSLYPFKFSNTEPLENDHLKNPRLALCFSMSYFCSTPVFKLNNTRRLENNHLKNPKLLLVVLLELPPRTRDLAAGHNHQELIYSGDDDNADDNENDHDLSIPTTLWATSDLESPVDL